MKKTIEIEISRVRVVLPIKRGEKDIPNDFPLRTLDVWEATIAIDTGIILEWPKGKKGDLYMMVCDEGTYILEHLGAEVSRIEGRVPHGLIPGLYGDYVDFWIDENGRITNWPEIPNVDKFFKAEQ